jgi:hypothetical protein
LNHIQEAARSHVVDLQVPPLSYGIADVNIEYLDFEVASAVSMAMESVHACEQQLITYELERRHGTTKRVPGHFACEQNVDTLLAVSLNTASVAVAYQ